ncbi:DoxX family protein [Prolixibacteraceae bacterium JC049]|nr:DoxX family protein [Prolixibacteraceae bacterium JC049]
MNTKTNKIVFWTSTGLLSLMMLMSASMYFFKNEMVASTFEALGYPVYIIYPLAIAKILGVVAIITNKSKILKHWAYAGFFFDFVLALFAHIAVNDGEFMPVLVAIVLLFISYSFECKVRGCK